jgi:hypothetical protein
MPHHNGTPARRDRNAAHHNALDSNGQPEDRELLRHAANAVHAVNCLARNYKQIPHASKRLYRSKDELLSLMLEMDVPGVVPAWQEQPDGDHLVIVSIGGRRAPHCPFRRLSWSAQCKVVQRIGPAPK